MERLTISLNDQLAEQFDTVMHKRGYFNRSEAMRDMIRDLLETVRSEEHAEGHCIATLSYIYSHHESVLASALTAAQHDHHDLTLSTMHVHMDHDNCLEVTALRGTIKNATLITPAVTARMMTDSFSRMLIYAFIIGAITGVAGMYLSYIFNAASGATIVLFGASLFCLAALIKRIREKLMLRFNVHRHGNLIHSHPHDHRHGRQDWKPEDDSAESKTPQSNAR
ncbi:MAG: nickel-responsive transcriptional regulator NikR [Nitrosospira sp.]